MTTTTVTTDELPELDCFSPEFAADPHAAYRVARANGWAARSPRGVEILTYDACEAVLLDASFRSGAPRLLDYLGEDSAVAMVGGPGRTLLGSEGDDHTVMRRTVSPWFTPKRVNALAIDTRRLVEELLAAVEADGACEYMTAVARVVPGVVFCWMVGAPETDGPQLATWSETLLKAFAMDPDDAPAISEAAAQLRTYIADLIAAKRARPGDDVASLLVAAAAAGTIDDDDVPSALFEMLAAATDNTMHSAGTQLWLLLEHPDQWRLLVDDPSRVSSAVEECGRFEPRVASTPVFAPEPITYRGLSLPADAFTWLVFASAHRDPDAFDDPDRFDVTRHPTRGQLSFGIGRHYCLGAALARMELRVMLEAVLDRWDDPHPAGEADVDRAYGTGIGSLPVAFTPKRS